MRIEKIISFVFYFILAYFKTYAQQKSDLHILSIEEFINIVRLYHPIVKQADINIQMAKANLLSARGGFDPSFYVNNEQKTFDGKNYYNYTNPELKIPTWYGIEVKAGLENNSGQFLNSEATSGQTSYVGLSVPLAKNLFIDKRRATLQQSKIFINLSNADRLNTINDIMFDAYAAYYNWVKEFQLYNNITEAVKVNEARFGLVKIGYRQGDRPAIDTVEALAQLQNFQYLQSESLVKYKNAALEISNFLWIENNTPYILSDEAPQIITSLDDKPVPIIDELLYTASVNHPKLKMFDYKLASLVVERKLKFQSLLPTVNLKTNLLNKGYSVLKNASIPFYENNYKFGLDVGMPLFFREGRGAYRAAKLKIQQNEYELSMQQLEVSNKIKYYYNEVVGLKQQIQISENIYKNNQLLFSGEDTRFKGGESTLFLLNSRENKVLETFQKLIELRFKLNKSLVALQWAAGQLR
ncbi:MAG: TolC family protein [Chitinophagaceae bacterium]|nr:TolC family protein [Chitinophagaceae bacterium]